MRNYAVRVLITAFACVAQLSACAGTQQGATLTPISVRQRPPNPIVGVYVSEYGAMNVLEYEYQGTGNPLCTLNLTGNVNSIQSDSKNELIVPETTGVNIYKERKYFCLSTLPLKAFPQITTAIDGFSVDGKTYYFDLEESIAVCVWGTKPHCPRMLTNPQASLIEGITADATGVYASVQGNGATNLVYWQGAKGPGTVLHGFVNNFAGGLYMDGFGNLLAIDPAIPNNGGPALYVYSGCPSACKAHGPFLLGSQKTVYYASLGNGETRFMALDQSPVSSIDVYQYNGIDGITFLYSNSAGLNVSNGPIAIAQYLP